MEKLELLITDTELRKEYEAGSNGVALGKKYNVSCDAIYKRLKSVGCTVRSRGGLNKIALPITSDELKIKYDGGLSCRQLADEYNVSPATIHLLLKSADYVPRPSHVTQIDLPVTDQQLKDEYDSGINIRELAEKYGVCQVTIWQRLRSAGYVCRPHGGKNTIKLSITNQKLKEEYESGASCSYLRDKYGVSKQTILRRLKVSECVIRSNSECQLITLPVTNEELKKEYEETGLDIRGLAEKYNTTNGVIYLRLRNIGCKMRDASQRGGENHWHWKGGTSFEPYCPKFNETFKESIREKFNRICFLCGKSEGSDGRKLSVHHVNYDKNCLCNDSDCEFVPMCMSCHAKTTNGDRNYYESLIMDKIRQQSLQE